MGKGHADFLKRNLQSSKNLTQYLSITHTKMKNKPTKTEVDEALRKMSMLAARCGIEYVIIEDEYIDTYCEDNELTLTDEQRADVKGAMCDYLREQMESDECLNCVDDFAESK